MKSAFRFRLNGEIIPEIQIRHVLVDRVPSGELEIAVKDEAIGWFTIDDNSNLWDKDLPRFVLEYRDENIPRDQRRLMHNRGWVQVTPRELLDVLAAAGLIKRR